LGYKAESDFFMSDRVSGEVSSGPAKGRALGPHFKDMRKEYYDCLSWDTETGEPSEDALEKVGLGGYRVGRN
ncbi:MAG: aldehyde ferredoxin oxidoreductase C-terminal domain-containing protein, partial [Rhodospirillales bacterium]|nr:aldehyde ferredoxin oxidoreductase C-terminal domain-containing protein [Rhodospirillales bacterium]